MLLVSMAVSIVSQALRLWVQATFVGVATGSSATNARNTNSAAPNEFFRFCFQSVIKDYSIPVEEPIMESRRVESCNRPLPPSLHCSTFRSYMEDDADERDKNLCSPLSDLSQDISDVDLSLIQEFCCFKSVNSSPLDSPVRTKADPSESSSAKISITDLEASGFLKKTGTDFDDRCLYDSLSVYSTSESIKVEQPLDFERNGVIWLPPPPLNEYDDVEKGRFELDDDDYELGGSSRDFSSCGFDMNSYPTKERPYEVHKKTLKRALHGHFTALVSQLLKDEEIGDGNDVYEQDWLEIVCSLAWQAANFVKPDTRSGGSMDPANYVKIKCLSSGNPRESSFIRGVVCTKNVRHKRMVSQHRCPRILILGGSLEFQKVSNTLASINTILEQEMDHLKRAVGIIQAHRPNVLLVEKSVASYAKEYLLEKEISLVLNVKRRVLDRISRCTGAQVVPSIDHLASAKLGQCGIFRVEKVCEVRSPGCSTKQNSNKTLMFFDGCPRRLGCTVLLRGSSYEKLKKIKKVLQYACFAAYHLSLETSFLADEGAKLPGIPSKPMTEVSECWDTSGISTSSPTKPLLNIDDKSEEKQVGDSCNNLGVKRIFPCSNILCLKDGILNEETEEKDMLSLDSHILYNVLEPTNSESSPDFSVCGLENSCCKLSWTDVGRCSQFLGEPLVHRCKVENSCNKEEIRSQGTHLESAEVHGEKVEQDDDSSTPRKFLSASDQDQSILVSLSSSCVLKGALCERSKLLRIKFYGRFDKPLGSYLRDDLFDLSTPCRICKESVETHVRCYTHQHGCLRISVRRLSFIKLPGERDGKIWMWHRCLKCDFQDGVPPAAHRVVMSDAAWGLSFGKFLELSFSNHATANRLASCGHSLQRDCFRFYGLGNMVAIFRYSPINILSVHLPRSLLNFTSDGQVEWANTELAEVSRKIASFHEQVRAALVAIEQMIVHVESVTLRTSLRNHIVHLNDLLIKEENDYDVILQRASVDNIETQKEEFDVLELNRLRRCLLKDSSVWDRRVYLLELLIKIHDSPFIDTKIGDEYNADGSIQDGKIFCSSGDSTPKSRILSSNGSTLQILECKSNNVVDMNLSIESIDGFARLAGLGSINDQFLNSDERCIAAEWEVSASLERQPSEGSSFSDKIDLAWCGTGLPSSTDCSESGSMRILKDHLFNKKAHAPVRVFSFDSALRAFKREPGDLGQASIHLSSMKSFDSSGDLIARMRKDSSLSFQRVYASEGARLLLPRTGHDDVVVAIYDQDPASIIAYAVHTLENCLSISREFDPNEERDCTNFVEAGPNVEPQFCVFDKKQQATASKMSADTKETHIRIAFDDEFSFPEDKVHISVTCYFEKKFAALRKRCCPRKLDYVHSLCRSKKWEAQGGKSNVYFAKSWNERFIIKQMTRTELDSFELFADQYFDYLTDSINSGSPSCLAKVLGIYQVSVKHMKNGCESKMDLMVMENLFFGRNISSVYDLKGSSRSRYNPNTKGSNKVMLDLNLLETIYTNPIYLGSKAKRCLERAIWNDTSFLASIDVMDYSLLVGVDEEKQVLVVGIIDFMRQYTWDKHLETWVKSSGILGGLKNASPTIISPMQYKKRFRKAMSKYFHTLPDHWTS